MPQTGRSVDEARGLVGALVREIGIPGGELPGIGTRGALDQHLDLLALQDRPAGYAQRALGIVGKPGQGRVDLGPQVTGKVERM